MPKKSDPVQLHAQTICFKLRGTTAEWGTKDFEVLELGQSPNSVDPARLATLVELDAGISQEQALKSLQWIMEHIEKNGLPETTREVPKDCAVGVMKAQQLLEKTSAILEELPAGLRTRFYEYPQKAEVAADEDNDHE